MFDEVFRKDKLSVIEGEASTNIEHQVNTRQRVDIDVHPAEESRGTASHMKPSPVHVHAPYLGEGPLPATPVATDTISRLPELPPVEPIITSAITTGPRYPDGSRIPFNYWPFARTRI